MPPPPGAGRRLARQHRYQAAGVDVLSQMKQLGVIRS
jgi:hypothetical protein